MDERIWYLGNGDYLEGDEAYDHIKELNEDIIELHRTVNRKLDEIKEYMNEYTIRETEEFEDIYENVLELGEICSAAAILLDNLSEYIEERI